VEYFDVVPRALTFDPKLSFGARVTWIAVRAFIQEGDKRDRASRSRLLYQWQLAADLEVTVRTIDRWLAELEAGGWIERVSHRRGGTLIVLQREHGNLSGHL
jgi:hypothetical protein